MRTPTLAASILALVALAGPVAQADVKVGVTAAVNPQAIGQPPTEPERVLMVGADNFANEKITTGPNGQVQLLFMDGSAISVGPDAELKIDDFVYDPNSRTGKLAVSAAQGVLRFVGGAISKSGEATITTPTATIGIRGGVFLLSQQRGGSANVVFLYGKGLTVSSANVTQTITRSGFGVSVAGPGQPPSSPAPVPPGTVSAVLGQLQKSSSSTATSGTTTGGTPAGGTATAQGGQSAQGGQGGQEAPQDAALAQSGVSSSTGSNLAPQALGPVPVGFNTTFNPNTGTLLQNVIAQASDIPGIQRANDLGKQIQALQQQQTTTTQLFGHFYADDLYVAGSFNPLQNGNLSATYNPKNNFNVALTLNGSGGNQTITFQAPNNTNGTTGQQTVKLPTGSSSFTNLPLQNGTVTGTVTVTSDLQFANAFGTFTPNTAGNGCGSSGDNPCKFFVFGGVPTPNLPTSGVATYAVSTIGQNIPFVKNFGDGGNSSLISGVGGAGTVISPLNVRWSPITNATLAANSSQRATFHQATLVIAGTGVNQQFGLFGVTGAFFQEQGSTVAMAGGLVGGVIPCATCISIRVSSAVSSSQIAGPGGTLGNAIYGPNANYIVTVPDNVTGIPNNNDLRTSAAQAQFPLDTLASQQTDNGKFVPSILTQNAATSAVTQQVANGAQTTQTLTGFTAGGVEVRAANGNVTLTGFSGTPPNATFPGVSITTDASTNRLSATFGIGDGSSTSNSYILQFGGTSGFGGGRSSFVSDTLFAAREAASTTQLSNGNFAVTSTRNGVTVINNNLLLVNSNVVPIDFQTFAGPGVTACTCSFMQWGWWIGEVQNPSSQGSGFERFIGTWVVGNIPSASEIPTTGTATYNGHAIGVVSAANTSGATLNSGQVARYIAAGNYTQTWDFAHATGTATISNFDRGGVPGANGLTASGTVSATQSPGFNGSVSGSGVSGFATGSFFKNMRTNDPIAGVGGNFSLSGTVAGKVYGASGTFAGCRAGTPC